MPTPRVPRPPRTAAHNRDAWLIAAAAIAWLAFAAAFCLPGHSMDWGRDLLVFFGQINALEHGQAPYRDFRTSVGALPFYLPWLGYRLSGGFAGALEIAGLLATALLLPCVVVVLRVRLGLPTALAMLLCIAAMAATPVDLGHHVPSHVGFYNRWASAGLAALLLFAVPPKATANPHLEGAAAAMLLLFLFFVKASYFAVGVAFLVGFGAVLGLFRRVALTAASGAAAALIAVQAATGSLDDYLAELAHSFGVSGVSWYARKGFLTVWLPRSLNYHGILAGACIFAFVGKASLCWRRWLFVLFAALACLAIQGHDAGFIGPFPLLAALALLGERTARPWRRWLRWLLGLFMFPYLLAAARTSFDMHRDDSIRPAELPRMADVYMEDLSRGGSGGRSRHSLFHVADELAAGLRLLDEHGIGDHVFGLDYYNYFPALLDVAPLRGRLAVLMPGRTLDNDTAPPPATLFRHAAYVMVPTTLNDERRVVQARYGEHVRLRYTLLDANIHWQLWERKPP